MADYGCRLSGIIEEKYDDHADSGSILGSGVFLLKLQLVVDLGHARRHPSGIRGVLDVMPR
jgi:hypothetical protein